MSVNWIGISDLDPLHQHFPLHCIGEASTAHGTQPFVHPQTQTSMSSAHTYSYTCNTQTSHIYTHRRKTFHPNMTASQTCHVPEQTCIDYHFPATCQTQIILGKIHTHTHTHTHVNTILAQLHPISSTHHVLQLSIYSPDNRTSPLIYHQPTERQDWGKP